QGPGQPWKTIGPLDPVSSRDVLLALPGSRAVLKTSNGAVRLTLIGNMPPLSGELALESAVVLHANKAFDLDFSLERGRVVVANKGEKGPVKVLVRTPEENWELTLKEPGATVAIESFARWTQGSRFSKEPKPGERPAAALSLWVVEGAVVLNTPTHE